MPVRVVTDSTSDLTAEMRAGNAIDVVPLKVIWGESSFVDGVDLTTEEFFQRLPTAKVLPKTSQPSPVEFEQKYRSLAAEGDTSGIVSVHISRKLSGTIQSAEIASRNLPDQEIRIVDSQTASLAMGLVAVQAARAAASGASLDEVVAVAESARDRTKVYFIVDTLEYLQKGGRIGKAAAFVGGLLNVKPILTTRDGEVHPVERQRSRAKALDRLVALLSEAGEPEEFAIMHSTTPEDAEALKQRFLEILPGQDILISRFGPVIGTYLGPGAIGAAVRVKSS